MWTAFFHLLNVNVSFTSGYHPQSNSTTNQIGADTYHGQNTCKIPFRNHLPVTTHFSACWDSNLHVFHVQENLQRCYGPEEQSWVNNEDILDPALTLDFLQNHHERPTLRPQGRPRHPAPPRARSRLRGGWLCYKCGLLRCLLMATRVLTTSPEYCLPFLTTFPTIPQLDTIITKGKEGLYYTNDNETLILLKYYVILLKIEFLLTEFLVLSVYFHSTLHKTLLSDLCWLCNSGVLLYWSCGWAYGAAGRTGC